MCAAWPSRCEQLSACKRPKVSRRSRLDSCVCVPGSKSAKSAEHLADLADLANSASEADGSGCLPDG
eukprot:13038193-Alexandrium_andersonii.AAC.1